MRVTASLALLFSFAILCAQDAPKPDGSSPEKALHPQTVHEVAENPIKADQLYGGKSLIYFVPVYSIEKVRDGYVLNGVGAGSLRGGVVVDIPGSEFKIKKGAETKFAEIKPTDIVYVRAKYTGTAKRIGVYKDYVVVFDEVEFAASFPLPKSKDAPKDK